MSSPRHPIRLGDKSILSEFYPRELTESDGKLFIHEDGTQTELNPDASTSVKGLVKLSTAVPKANSGSGSAGTSTDVSPADHIHPAQTSVSGNAGTATKLAAKKNIDGIAFDGSAHIHHYATCSTAAGTVAKVATVADNTFTLATGARVFVKFTNANTATNATLNVNSTGAKAMTYGGSNIASGVLTAGRTYEFVYNGTAYELIGDLYAGVNSAIQSQLNTLSGRIPTVPDISVTDNGTGNVVSDVTASGHTLTLTRITALTSHQTIPNISVTESGSGNVVTKVEATGHAITATKGITALTSHQTIPSISVNDTESGNVVTDVTSSGHTLTLKRGITALTSHQTIPDISVDSSGTGYVSDVTASGHALTVTKTALPTISASTTGSGNVVTKVEATGHSITATKGITALTSHQAIPDVAVTPSGSGNVVTALSASGHTVTYTKGITALTAHPTISKSTDSTSTPAALSHGGTFTAVDSITRDGNGHVTKINTKTVTLPSTIPAGSITGIISVDNLPAGALERMYVCENDTAKAALTSADVQNGDVVSVESTGLMYYVVDDTKLGTSSHDSAFRVFTAGGATSVPWSGVTGKPDIALKSDIPTIPTISASTTGSGNVVTKVEATGHSITATKGITALTSHQTIPTVSVSESGSGNVVTKIAAGGTNGHALTVTKGITALTSHQTIPDVAVTPSGSGNVVTALSASGHTITYTKGITALTSTPSISVTDTESGNVVTDVTSSGHTLTLKRGITALTSHQALPEISVSTTGNGNVFTAVSADDHALTFTKGITALTSHQTIPSISVTESGSGNVVTKVEASGHAITATKGITALTQHQTIPNISATASGSGNVVTALSASGHAITYTKGITALTSLSGYTNAANGGQGYGTCATAAATAAKVVTMSNYALVVGGIVSVKFTYAVPASATLNINSKGAKAIRYKGAAITAGIINAGYTATFIYDGSYYHLISVDDDSANVAANIGSFGPSANATPGSAGTFSVPYITVDSKGRVTAASSKTITMPTVPSIPSISVTDNGTGNVVSDVTASGHTLTLSRISALTAHQTIPSISVTESGSGNVVTKVEASGHAITATKGITALTSHQTIPTISATTSGSGNAVTSVTASGHAITVTKGTTFLTSHQNIPSVTATTSGSGNAVTAVRASGHALTVTKGKTFATTATYTASIGTSWTGSAAPYTQAITVSGMTASDNPVVDVILSDTYDTATAQLADYAKIYRITTAANKITVYANEKTETTLNIQLKCVR